MSDWGTCDDEPNLLHTINSHPNLVAFCTNWKPKPAYEELKSQVRDLTGERDTQRQTINEAWKILAQIAYGDNYSATYGVVEMAKAVEGTIRGLRDNVERLERELAKLRTNWREPVAD